MKNVLFFGQLTAISLLCLFSSCSKNSEINACSTQVNSLSINFNVLDKTTKQDLYFSSSPVFQTNDVYFFKKKDVARKDTIRPKIISSGTSRYFQYPIDYTSLQDTLILKTGSLSDNNLIYTVQKTNDSCPNYNLTSVNFNGSVLTPSSDKYQFLK